MVKKELPLVAITGLKSTSVTPRVEDNLASSNAQIEPLEATPKGNQSSIQIRPHGKILDLPTAQSHSRKSVPGSVVTQQKRATPVIVARQEMSLAGTKFADHLEPSHS